MPNTGKRLSYSSATPVAVVFVAPVDPLPDNCAVVRMLVPAASPPALYGEGAVGAAAVEGANCFRLVPGVAQDVPVGPRAKRGALVLNYASTAGATIVDLVYINDLGVPL